MYAGLALLMVLFAYGLFKKAKEQQNSPGTPG
jgi:hypothetical protein